MDLYKINKGLAMTTSLQYPIGKFQKQNIYTDVMLQEYIQEIASFPQRLRDAVQHLTQEQLDTRYRPDGWTIRQVVHHCADSHMNSLMRFKLALTEEEPVIRPYFEDRWAELPDSKIMDIASALQLLEGVHSRWTFLLKNLTPEELKKIFVHPEHGKEISLEESIAMYAWHGNHHLAHITLSKNN